MPDRRCLNFYRSLTSPTSQEQRQLLVRTFLGQQWYLSCDLIYHLYSNNERPGNDSLKLCQEDQLEGAEGDLNSVHLAHPHSPGVKLSLALMVSYSIYALNATNVRPLSCYYALHAIYSSELVTTFF